MGMEQEGHCKRELVLRSTRGKLSDAHQIEGISLLCLLSSSFHSLPMGPSISNHYTPREYLWLQSIEIQIKPGWGKISSLSPVSEKPKGRTASDMLDSSAQELPLPYLTRTSAFFSCLHSLTGILQLIEELVAWSLLLVVSEGKGLLLLQCTHQTLKFSWALILDRLLCPGAWGILFG